MDPIGLSFPWRKQLFSLRSSFRCLRSFLGRRFSVMGPFASGMTTSISGLALFCLVATMFLHAFPTNLVHVLRYRGDGNMGFWPSGVIFWLRGILSDCLSGILRVRWHKRGFWKCSSSVCPHSCWGLFFRENRGFLVIWYLNASFSSILIASKVIKVVNSMANISSVGLSVNKFKIKKYDTAKTI